MFLITYLTKSDSRVLIKRNWTSIYIYIFIHPHAGMRTHEIFPASILTKKTAFNVLTRQGFKVKLATKLM